MTYHELKTRLTQVETALKSLQTNTNKSLPSTYVKETVRTLTTIKESLQEKLNLLAEAEDGTIYTDDEQKALKLADKGANVQLTKEEQGVEFSIEETKIIAKQTGKALVSALKKAGDQIARIKAHRLEENSFDIHVNYKGEQGEDEFYFHIEDGDLHLADFSFDKKLIEVGVKPSGEPIVNVDVLANELLKHFTSLNDTVNRNAKHYIKVSRRDYKKTMSILDNNVDPTYVKTDVVDDDGAGNVIMYFPKEDFDPGMVDDLEGEGVDISRDTNLPIGLNESLLDQISEEEEEEPTPEEPGEENGAVLEDATDTILSKFPTVKAAIVKLQTEDFKEFVESVDWISPRPTTFRINLKNGQDYILKWTGSTFEAQIMGKRYYINKISDYQQALDKLNILYKEAPMTGAGEEEGGEFDADTGGGGGGGDFPGDDAAGGGEGGDDLGGDLGGEEGGEDLSDEPIDFESGEEG